MMGALGSMGRGILNGICSTVSATKAAFNNYLISTCIVIAFVVVTILMLIIMPKAKCYFDMGDIDKETKIAMKTLTQEPHFNDLLEEANKAIYNEAGVCNLYDNEAIYETKQFPRTWNLLLSVPDVCCAFFATIKNNTKHTKKRIGSSQTANSTIRCVLPLKIPGTRKSGTWVDGETKFYTDGEWLMYDDSRENSYFNEHRRGDVVLLVVDINRPHKFPIGISAKKHHNIF